MPTRNVRALGLGGQGDPSTMGNALAPMWADCDRVFVEEGDVARAWPGHNRRGRKLFDATVHGAASNALQVMGADPSYIRKASGHLLAVVDRNSATAGRVLALAWHAGGLIGSQMVGRPAVYVAADLDDLETRGVYSGSAPLVYTVQVDAESTPDTFRWTSDGGATFGASGVAITGDWQTLENGIEIRFGATTGHTDGDAWTLAVGGRPMLLATMERQGPHVYPAIVGANGRTMLVHSQSAALLDDGAGVREAGLRPPQIQPQLASASLVVAGNEDYIARTDADPLEWVAAAEGVIVSRVTTPTPASGLTGCIKIEPPITNLKKVDLAYIDTSGTIAATVKRLRLWAYNGAQSGYLVSKHRELVIASATGLGGTRIVLPLAQRIYAGRWVQIDIPWKRDSAFAYASIGIRSPRTAQAPLIIDAIEAVDDSDIDDSEILTDQEWRFQFTWIVRDEPLRESAPSAPSDVIEPDGKAVELDLSGQYPGIDTGLANTAPADADAVHVYAFKQEFGIDPRTGGGAFFRLTPALGIALTVLQRIYSTVVAAGGSNTGDGTVQDIQIIGAIDDQVVTLTAQGSGPSATFTVVGATAGAFSDATSGANYISADNVLRFKITDGAAGWVSGDTLTITIASTPRTDGKLVARIGNELGAAVLTEQPRPPFWNRQVDPADAAAADGALIVLGGQPPYSVGQWTWTNASNVIVPVASATADTPVPSAWMEGRTIRQSGSLVKYRIVKAIDNDGDGVIDALWIARSFDPDENEYIGAFEGATGDARGIVEGDEQSVWWTNNSGARGIDVETASVLNRLKIMPAGDRVIGIGKAGEFLWVMGQFNAFLMRQDPSALADDPAVPAYSNPLHLPNLGLLARRCWLTLPDGAAMFFTSRGELTIVDPSGGHQRHPVSDKLVAFLTGWGLLADAKSLRHSFAEYIADGKNQFVYLGLIGGAQADAEGEPGVVGQATDHWRDRTVGVSGDALTGTEGIVDWSAYTIADETLATLNNDPSPVEAFDQGAIGDNNDASAAAASAAFPRFASSVWTPDLANDLDIVCERVKTGAIAPTEAYIADQNDPNFVQAAPPTGGVGLPRGGVLTNNFFPRGWWGIGAHRISIPNTFPYGASHPTNQIASYEIAVIAGFGYHNLVPQGAFLIFECYFEGTGTIPAGTFGIATEFGEGSPTDQTIDQPLVGGQWNKIYLALNNNDSYDSETGTFKVDQWSLYQLTAIDAGLYDGDGLVILRFCNGRIANVSDLATADSPAEPLDFGEACDEPGSVISTAALGDDFRLGILIDLTRQAIYLGSECRFTCAGVSPASSCTSQAMQPGPAFMGTREGYVHQVFENKVLTWGSPDNRFVFDADSAAPGSSTTIKIDRSFDGVANQLALDLDADGNGLLDGLIVAKAPSSTSAAVEFRRIASNTVDTITISTPWDDNPVAGDQAIVAPLPWMIQFAERRFDRSGLIRSMRALAEIGGVRTASFVAGALDPRVRLEAIVGTDGQTRLTDTAADASRWVGLASTYKRLGTVELAAKAGKAVALRLTALGGQDGPLRMREILIEERWR